MTANGTWKLEGSREYLALVLRCSVTELSSAIPNLKESGLGDVMLHGNGHVTFVSRRLKREAAVRENGRLRVERHREKHICNKSGNAKVPLGSGSGSDSESGIEGQGGKGLADLQFLRGELNRLYQRAEADSFGYIEEYTAAAVVRNRVAWRAELDELKKFRLVAEFFPESLQALLEKWGPTVDRARNHDRTKTTHKPNPRNIGIATDPTEQGRKIAAHVARQNNG